MQMVSLIELRRTASRILAAAVVELFPGTLLVQGGETPLGFYYDFIFPFVFKKEFLPLLEERMRQIKKEVRSIQLLEMMPKNAAEFLLYHGLDIRAEAASKVLDSTTQVFRMDSFVDLCEEGAGADSGIIGVFKLQEVQPIEETTRIFGTAFENKQELKTFLKKIDNLPGLDHKQLGIELSLFSKIEDSWIWHPKGEIVRNLWLQFWQAEHLKQNFHIIRSFPLDMEVSHLEYHRKTKIRRVAECNYKEIIDTKEALTDLFEVRPYFTDRVHLFCESSKIEEEVISSLQFILTTSKIFDFEFEVLQVPSWRGKNDQWLSQLVKGAGIDVQFDLRREKSEHSMLEICTTDALGRKWVISFLKVDFQKNIILRSSFVSLERLIALGLERHKGRLPFWLAPEQVRVIAVSESMKEEALRFTHILRAESFRVGIDCEVEKLSKRMHNLLQEKVPYCIFIGEREQKLNRVTLRTNYLEREESLSFEEVLQKLEEMNRKKRFEN